MDDPQKKRGPGRDILFCNEANELTHEDFKQLNMRTRKLILLDYNPSDEFHWIYDYVLTREDCLFFKTTYLDNPYLPLGQIKEIERLKSIDPNYWRIYGLGEKGIGEATIYKNWSVVNTLPEDNEVYFGLDFGYNHPSVLIKVNLDEYDAYVEELLYEKGLTNADLIRRLDDLNISKTATIYADCARPEMIDEIHRAGYNIHPTIKGAGSVKNGIDIVKRYKIFVYNESVNTIKEFKSYKWKVDKDDRVLDEPVKVNDDAMDAVRYGFNFKLQPTAKFEVLEL